MNKEVLAVKEKKVSSGTLIMLLIILVLIGLCLWRLIAQFYKYSIIIRGVFIGILAICIYYFVKELITLFKFLKVPNNIIEKDEEKLYLYADKKMIELKIEDIFRIDIGSDKNTKFLFYQANLIIRTKETSYKVEYVKDIDNVYKMINELISPKDDNQNEENH